MPFGPFVPRLYHTIGDPIGQGPIADQPIYASSPDVTVGLTGIGGTSAIGTLVVAVSIGLSGLAGTSAAGTLTSSASLALTHVVATGAVGTTSPVDTRALSNVVATGAVGTLTATQDTVAALSGVGATGALGTLTSVDVVALSNVAGTGAVGTVTASQENGATLTGVAGTGSVDSLSVSTTTALTDVVATGSVGTLTASVSSDVEVALTNVVATGAIGTVTETHGGTLALSGVEGIGAIGSLSLPSDVLPGAGSGFYPYRQRQISRDVTVALRGVQAKGYEGVTRASRAWTVALSSVSAETQTGDLTVDAVVSLLPISATSAAGICSTSALSVQTVTVVKEIPVPVTVDTIDKAWVDLQQTIADEDDLLAMGVFDDPD